MLYDQNELCVRRRFEGILTLTRLLNKRYRPADVQRMTRLILLSLFPAWLLPAFRVMFARPLPTFSRRLNAAVTAWTCQWLMVPAARLVCERAQRCPIVSLRAMCCSRVA